MLYQLSYCFVVIFMQCLLKKVLPGAQGQFNLRRRRNYLVKNLLGKEPPKEYQLESKADLKDGDGQITF